MPKVSTSKADGWPTSSSPPSSARKWLKRAAAGERAGLDPVALQVHRVHVPVDEDAALDALHRPWLVADHEVRDAGAPRTRR